MNNAECTPLSWAEEMELMGAFPRCLSERGEALARKFFNQIVFFRTIEKNTRRCVCTSCMEGFLADKAIYRDFFRKKHKDTCECPNCGQRATLLAMGKYKNFSQLESHQRAVQIKAYKDWLLVQAGWCCRRFDNDDLGGCIDFVPFRRYAFAPGRRAMWGRRAVSWFGLRGVDGPWRRMERIKEPFQSRAYEREASYFPMGAELIAKSSLRYCQYDQWFDSEFGGLIYDMDWESEPFRIAHLIQYLSEYTRRPQMEVLVKLGYYKIVSDLVIHRKPHKDILNWDAEGAPGFFRLSKQDFRFFKNGGCHFDDLKDFRFMQRHGLVRDLEEFVTQAKGLSHPNLRRLVQKGAKLASVRLERAVGYIRSFQEDNVVMAQIWVDYLDASRALKYDLSRDDVRMPKNLLERHDEAARAVRAVEDEKQIKRYRVRREKLAAQFAFSADGLTIVVPGGVQDIVREGKILKHCVGGYADRHVEGKVTILFLRRESAPAVPYITIEMSTENNCKALRIRQIHGYKNDMGARQPPEAKHAEFLGKWMAWVHAGSPRDEEGRPIIPQLKGEEGAA